MHSAWTSVVWFAVATVLAFGTAAPAQVALPKSAAATKPASRPATGPGALAGDYLGPLEAGAVTLRLGLKLEYDGKAYKGVLNSLDQGGAKMNLDSVVVEGQTFKFTVKVAGAAFEGKVAPDGNSIEGTWRQGTVKLPLTFKRVDAAPTLNRPQEPKPPFPYVVEEVVVENKAAGVRLAGTLTKPKSGAAKAAAKLPAVLLITGSGQQDRDEMIMSHRPFLVLADHLTRNAGIVVLRLDDRGIGGSTGDYGKATTTDYVADAAAAVAYLRARPDVDPDRVGLLGHSEGGVTGPLVAAADRRVAFVILLAGIGVPMDQMLLRQQQDLLRAMGMPDAKVKEMGKTQAEALKTIKEVDDPAAVERKLRELDAQAVAALSPEERKQAEQLMSMREAQMKMAASPWFRQLVRYDPRPTLAKVKCPVLAVCGEKDIQVAAKDNLAGIKSGLEAGGNKDVTVVELPGLNHLLQECKTGTIDEYGTIEQTMSPKALELVAGWLKSHAFKAQAKTK